MHRAQFCWGCVLTICKYIGCRIFLLGVQNQSDHYIKKACSYHIIFSTNFYPKIKRKIVLKHISPTYESSIFLHYFFFSKISLRYFFNRMAEFFWRNKKSNMKILHNPTYTNVYKVHIFWEGHKILRNLHLTFVLCSASQK